VRIDIRMQDTVGGETVVSASESGSDADLPALVTRAGDKLRSALGAGDLSAGDSLAARRAMPANPAAARLYSEGLARNRLNDFVAAKGLFEQAIAADPSSPLPHVALAEAFQELGYDARAKAEAQKAFELSDGLPREQRLAIEARFHETNGANDK